MINCSARLKDTSCFSFKEKIPSAAQGKTDGKNFLDLEKIISPIKLGRTADKASKIYKEISDEGKRKSY